MVALERIGEALRVGLVELCLEGWICGERPDAVTKIIASDGDVRVENWCRDHVLRPKSVERLRYESPACREEVTLLAHTHPRVHSRSKRMNRCLDISV